MGRSGDRALDTCEPQLPFFPASVLRQNSITLRFASLLKARLTQAGTRLPDAIFRRLYSTATITANIGSTSHEIAAEFLSRCQRRGPLVQKQFIDANQLQRLIQALNRP